MFGDVEPHAEGGEEMSGVARRSSWRPCEEAEALGAGAGPALIATPVQPFMLLATTATRTHYPTSPQTHPQTGRTQWSQPSISKFTTRHNHLDKHIEALAKLRHLTTLPPRMETCDNPSCNRQELESQTKQTMMIQVCHHRPVQRMAKYFRNSSQSLCPLPDLLLRSLRHHNATQLLSFAPCASPALPRRRARPTPTSSTPLLSLALTCAPFSARTASNRSKARQHPSSSTNW